MPLLELALLDEVEIAHILTATMEGDSIPYGKRSDASDTESVLFASVIGHVEDNITPENQNDFASLQTRPDTKIVDLVLVLDPPGSSNLGEAIYTLIDEIDNGKGRPHVNQISYVTLQKTVIAVSIEAKAPKSDVGPLVRLGFWVAA
ncbi:hypothetical protein F4680DRAFT_88087 [Xylaria scruposa]|nr:hypothetical protein F4680DRAFT_88087 [Xylaria scruposa]